MPAHAAQEMAARVISASGNSADGNHLIPDRDWPARARIRSAVSPSGVVRVTASEMIGAEALPPMLAALRRAHPGVTVELVLNNRSDDLLRREADVAVRMTQPRQAALAARKLGEVGLGLYGRRDYLEAAGRPASIGELSGHDLIGFDRETLSADSLGADVSALPRQAFRVRTDSDLAQLALLRAGAGIGVAQHPIAARLRGTRLDPFGYTEIRRTERELIVEYRELVDAILGAVGSGSVDPGAHDPRRLSALAELAALPDMIRGYEQIKMDNVARYRAEVARRRAELGI